MQPCSPVPKARRFWRAPRALTIFGPAWSRVRLVSADVTSATRPRRRATQEHDGNTARDPRIGIGMAETTEKTGEKKLSVSPSKTLTLKGRGVEQGVVRQSFSHGRTKAVVVEKVKSRVPTRAKADAATSVAPAKRAATGKPAAPAAAAAAAPKPSGGMVLRSLTEEEQKARVHALNDARLREAEERKIAEEEAFVRSLREAAERTEREAAEARKADEEKRRKHDLEAKVKAEQEAKKRFGE